MIRDRVGLEDPAVRTLGEMIELRGTRFASERAVVLIDGKERDWTMTYGEVLERSRQFASSLVARGLSHGERVMIMLPSGSTFFSAFFGTLLAGGVPVPLYPPYFASQIEDFLSRYEPIAADCQASFLITFKDVRILAAGAAAVVKSLRGVLTPEDLAKEPARPVHHLALPDDVCFLQYTSGSTGQPKGVEITHRNVLENVFGIGFMVDRRPTDVTVSWLPLYHDMGLIGGLLCSLFWGVPLVLLSPQQFVKYPIRWLRAISRFRGTFSPAPNFAYRICSKIPDADLAGLDLSSWRVAFNGAEPVDLDTLEVFTKKFARYGFRPTTPFPVYGAAEATLAITHPEVETMPIVEYVDRKSLTEDRSVARLCPKDHAGAAPYIGVGRPLPFTDLEIVSDDGVPLPERHVGEIRVRGPGVMKGYHGNPALTDFTLRDGWLWTGDLGYLSGGNLFITGRKKDLIIRNGKNYYPQDFEDPARRVDGVRKSGVVAFGDADPDTGTERIVVLAESSAMGDAKVALVRAISKEIAGRTGVAPDRIELVPPRSILKTSSGKVRRRETRELWKSGAIFEQSTMRQRVLLGVTAARSVVQLARLEAKPLATNMIRTLLGVFGVG